MAGNASLRGHQGQFAFFENGAPVALVAIKKVTINQDSDFLRSEYVGQGEPEGDQSIKGWSGNLEAEVKDAVMDDLIDALITNNLNGIGVSDYTFTSTQNYADGTSRSWVYFDVQLKMSFDQAGLSEKMTKRLDFQASGRKAL